MTSSAVRGLSISGEPVHFLVAQLRLLRIMNHLRQSDLADLTGKNTATFSVLEMGRVADTRFSTIEAYAGAVGHAVRLATPTGELLPGSRVFRQLRDIRFTKSMSCEAVARAANLSAGSMVSRAEDGTQDPYLSTVDSWAAVFDLCLALAPVEV